MEDRLSQTLIEKTNPSGGLREVKEPEMDSSVKLLLDEVNKYKQLYENALNANSENGDCRRLLADVEKYKDQCSRAEEKLFVMLEYEVKFKEAKVMLSMTH